MNTENAGYKELKAFIKTERAKSPQNIAFWGNYTQKSTSELKQLVNRYNKKNENSVDKTVKKETQKSNDNSNVVREIQTLLQEAIDKLSTLPKEDSEAVRLNSLAMEIEFELSQLEN